MFLNTYLKSKKSEKILLNNFYSKIVTVSRDKIFYKKMNVPDTLDGRFDLLILFSIITIFFLSKFDSKGKSYAQSLFDKVFLDLDLTLRELGAGDAGVRIKIKSMINSYMGRQKAYCLCFEENNYELLKKTIINNVYRNVRDFNDSPTYLTNYCIKILKIFNKKPEKFFFDDEFNFPKL